MKWFIVYLFVFNAAPNGMGAIVADNHPFPDLAACRAALVYIETTLHNGMHLVCAGNDAAAQAVIKEQPDVYLPR
jgi:hypothetical protein